QSAVPAAQRGSLADGPWSNARETSPRPDVLGPSASSGSGRTGAGTLAASGRCRSPEAVQPPGPFLSPRQLRLGILHEGLRIRFHDSRFQLADNVPRRFNPV